MFNYVYTFLIWIIPISKSKFKVLVTQETRNAANGKAWTKRSLDLTNPINMSSPCQHCQCSSRTLAWQCRPQYDNHMARHATAPTLCGPASNLHRTQLNLASDWPAQLAMITSPVAQCIMASLPYVCRAFNCTAVGRKKLLRLFTIRTARFL